MRCLPDFRKRQLPSEVWYDLELDEVLIEQSVATQYGVLPSKQGDLSFADWIKLVGGLMPETPLGQVVAIRSEKEREIIQRMTPAQRQIRSEWTAHRAHTVSPGDAAEQMQQLSAMLAGLFGRR